MILQQAVCSCLRYLVVVVCLAWAAKAVLITRGHDGRKLPLSSSNSRSVIPDQSELDEVDEEALERGHEQFIVDKDDETLTEVIQDDKAPDTIPFVSVTLAPIHDAKSTRNSSKLQSSTNTSSQIKQTLNLPADNKTSLPRLCDTNQTKYDNDNSLSQDSSNLNSTQSTNDLINKNIPTRNSTIKKKCSKLSENGHGEREVLNVNGTKTVTNVSSVSYSTEAVQDTNNNTQLSLEGMEVGRNISEMKNSQNKSSSISDDTSSGVVDKQSIDVATEQSGKNSTSIQMADTNTSDVDKAGGLFYANATKNLSSSGNVTSEMNSSPGLARVVPKAKPNVTAKLNKKLNATMLSEQKQMQNASLKNVPAGNGSQILPLTNVRRANIIHKTSKSSTSQRSTQPSQKLRSFLTAVKEMFNKPETAHDILSWEAWGPCSRSCGVGALRTRQRKCGSLVARDFDVACPEPRRQVQKCPVVQCPAKSLQKHSKPFAKTKQVKTHDVQRNGVNNDKGNVKEMFEKHKKNPRVGTEDDVNKVTGDEALAEGDESSTEDDDDRPEGYDDTSEYTNNVASVQTANQKRYLYTVWGAWSACTRTCGQRAYAFRKRYCINAVTGEIKRHCQRPTILAKKCAQTPCPVDGGLSDWSKWSTCSGKCGIMERHRSCTRPKPAYGGRECFKLPVQMRLCGTCTEDKVTAVQNLASYSPKVLCGFDPCQRVGCLEHKGAICVTDFDCNPNFFNDKGNVLKGCKDANQLFLRPLAQKKCSFNPCSFAKCDVDGVKCLVDTKCRPFFVNELGKRVTCRGSNVLRISSDLICGFNPCKITTCTVDPEAKCITDYRCNPIFINAAGQRISGCTEDEVEAAESLSTGAPTAAPQSTENPSARDTTPQQNHNHRHQAHGSQKYREEASVKKTIENNIDETKKKLDDITRLENILARRLNDSATSYSENSTNTMEGLPDESSQHLSARSKLHAKENALDIKFLERVLQNHLDPNGTVYSQNTTASGENLREGTADKSDSQNEHYKDNSIAAFNLGSGDGTPSDSTVTLKTVHENDGETTEIVDTPSTETKLLNAEVFDQPVTFTDKVPVDMTEKPLEAKTAPELFVETDSNSRLGLGRKEKDVANISQRKHKKQLADVDRFILDELYRKKMKEDAGTKALGSSGGARPEGKIDLVMNETTGVASEYNTNSQGSSSNVDNTGDSNDSSYIHHRADNNDHNNIDNNKNSNNAVISSNFNENNDKNVYSNDNTSNSIISVHQGGDIFENNAVVLEQSNNSSSSTDTADKHDQSRTSATINNNNNININKNNNDLISDEANQIQLTAAETTTTTAATSNNNINKNINNNNNNNNNNVISSGISNSNNDSFNINNNSNSDHNTMNYPLNTKTNHEQPVTPPTIVHTVSKTAPSLQKITPHYNLLPAKLASIKNLNKVGDFETELRAPNKPPHLSKISSDKKHGKNINDDISLDRLWDNYLADSQHKKPDGYDSSTVLLKPGRVKLANGGKMMPGSTLKMVNTLTGKPERQFEHIPILHSSDPDLQISPYDEDVASNALAKEQDENPEGIPSNAELNKILDSDFVTNLTGGNHGSNTLSQKTQNQPADYVAPQTSPGVHEPPSIPVSQQVLPAQQDKTFSRLSSKPDSRVIDSEAHRSFINKLILKAVQKEIAKLKIDGIFKDALKNTKSLGQKESGETSSQEKQNMQEHKIGVTEKPSEYLGYEEDNTGHVGSTETPILTSRKHGRHDAGINKNLEENRADNGEFAEQGKQDKTGHLGINKRPNGVFVLKAKPYKAKDLGENRDSNGQVYLPNPKAIPTTMPIFQDDNGGDIMVTDQPGGATEKPDVDGEENDRETLRELDQFLKSDDPEDEGEKPNAKPEYVSNTPEESDVGPQWKDEEYSSPTGQQGIDEVNKGQQGQVREPEYKESYSPSLLNEIKELGLHEYFIKDGFQTPKHKKVDNPQVRQMVKSHHRKVDKYDDNQYDKPRYRPLHYGKKFHLAQLEFLPDENTHSALRQHNSGGDEIERVPSSHREENVVARSQTTHKHPKKRKSHVRSLSNFFNRLRHYYEQAHTEEVSQDLGNAIILTAKDDGDRRNYVQDSGNSIDHPKKRKRFSQDDNLMERNVSLDEKDVLNGKSSDLMVFRATDDKDRGYRRTLGIR